MDTPYPSDFYEYEDLLEHVDELAEAAPDLVSTRSLAETPEGRDVWCVTVANENAGPPIEKRPALLVTANLHASELAGSWVALHLLSHLVDRYPDDGTVSELLDERVVYVIPRITPDGAETAIRRRGKIVRSRYVDVDPDDVYDPNVVVPRDLDGDGRILRMRWPSEDGDRVPVDGDDRAMVSQDSASEEGESYRVVTEGAVCNYDGGEVRDRHYGFARSDFNRNFPSEGWRPFDWIGHGKYPLSEPETRAVGEFLYDHPNVTSVIDLHTGNPALFYPQALAGSDPEHPGDATLLAELGDRGEELTGFPYLWGYGERRGDEPTGELPGSFKDFVYERLGVPALLVELGMLYNYLGTDADELARPSPGPERDRTRHLLQYQDEHPDQTVFHEWEPYDHPELGTVEIGGLDRTTHGNPPAGEMPTVAERVTEFVLEFADYRPDVNVRDLSAESLGADLYRVSGTVVNRGRLPTHLTDRGLESDVHVPDRPRVELEGEADVSFVSGRPRRKLDHLDARGGRADLEWVVRAPDGATVELTVTAARGVFASERADLG